jgi:hypothetical protein
MFSGSPVFGMGMFITRIAVCLDGCKPSFQSMGDGDLPQLPGLFGFIQLTEPLPDRIPTVPDLLGLLFGFFPGAGPRGDSLVLPVSEQVEVLRTLTTSPLRLSLSRTIGRVSRVDGDSLGLRPEGNRLQRVHCKRVASLSCNSLALFEKCQLSLLL